MQVGNISWCPPHQDILSTRVNSKRLGQGVLVGSEAWEKVGDYWGEMCGKGLSEKWGRRLGEGWR